MWFKDIKKDDLGKTGGKGVNLGIMFNAEFPIPAGYIVTAQAYEEFLEKTNLPEKINQILSTINVEQTKDLQDKSKKIRDLIIGMEMPNDIKASVAEAYDTMEMISDQDVRDVTKILQSAAEKPFVAVRSSATAEDLPDASFAGQQATFLNVRGRDELLEAVKKCWASLFTARAIYYREKNDFAHDKVLIAVVVQKMVNSETSGIIFSANPATNDKDEIVIEAVYGLGETAVSGAVNPDLYIVDKESLEVKKAEVKNQEWGLFRGEEGNVKLNISEDKKGKQILDETEIVGLAKLAKKIEDHYQKPQDIEFAIENNKIYILQSRAITTLKEKTEESGQDLSNMTVLVTGLTASPGIGSGKVKIIKDATELDKVEEGDVLVTPMTNPDMVPAMKRAIAIVTNEGGLTSHAAIVSREMGIPSIVGTSNATQILENGQIVTVNANTGEVYEGEIEIEQEQKEEEIYEEIDTKTKIVVIMGTPDYAERAAKTGADGVGLLRLEFIIAGQSKHPAQYIREDKDDEYSNVIYEGIKTIAEAFKGKSVWVRTSDIRTDEYAKLTGGEKEPQEENPMMGWHGIRRSLDDVRILKAEFKAIKKLHDEGYKEVGIMIPFVIRAEEVKEAKEICREVGMEPIEDVEFGIMVETPASCWIIEEICKEGISFASFGTNDLTQLTLGIDRNNERIAKLFDEMHPAVLGEMEKVLDVCSRYNVKTSICGQAGSNPEMAEFLVRHGVHSISANPDAVNKIRKVVFDTEQKLSQDENSLG